MTTQQGGIAVIGAGLMGAAIAQVFASAGHEVAVHDPDPDARARVSRRIAAAFDLLGLDRATGGAVSVHDRIGDAVADAALVVEAGPEDLAVKRQIFAELVACANKEALLATNTSAIPIAEIVRGLASRHRMLGMHFWNPPYLVPLVEVVEAEETAAEAIEAGIALLRGAMLEPVHVRADIPGFIGNRLQHALKREAIALVAAGACSAEDIDMVVKMGFGARLALIGPLEQSDLVGLPLTLQIHDTLMPDLDCTAESHPYLVELVRTGRTGAAAGRGFREWTPEQAGAARSRLEAGLVDAALRRRRDLELSQRRPPVSD